MAKLNAMCEYRPDPHRAASEDSTIQNNQSVGRLEDVSPFNYKAITVFIGRRVALAIIPLNKLDSSSGMRLCSAGVLQIPIKFQR